MYVEGAKINRILPSESKTEFEVGTLSETAREKAVEDKVFIGCAFETESLLRQIKRNKKRKTVPEEAIKQSMESGKSILSEI
jgi:hypothetical protein